MRHGTPAVVADWLLSRERYVAIEAWSMERKRGAFVSKSKTGAIVIPDDYVVDVLLDLLEFDNLIARFEEGFTIDGLLSLNNSQHYADMLHDLILRAVPSHKLTLQQDDQRVARAAREEQILVARRIRPLPVNLRRAVDFGVQKLVRGSDGEGKWVNEEPAERVPVRDPIFVVYPIVENPLHYTDALPRVAEDSTWR